MKFDAKGIFKRFKRERFLGLTGPKAGGFLSLTGLWPEGCGGGFAANYKKAGPIPVISTEAKRSGEISPPSDGTGSITVGDLSTQSIMGSVSICSP